MADAGHAIFGDDRSARTVEAAVRTSARDLVVITWDGRGAPHELVHFDQAPTFDLLTIAYMGNAECPKALAKHHYFRSCTTEGKGQIFQVVSEFLDACDENYHYVGILDDDILIKVSDIHYLLHVARCFALDAFAPSLGEDAFHSHPHTLKREHRLLRPVRWIEVMMPFYNVELFKMASPFFSSSISSWGIDKYAIPLMQKIRGMQRTAVIDGVVASHVRPVRSAGTMYSNGFNAFQEMELVRKRCVAYIEANDPDLLHTEWFRETFDVPGRGARLSRTLKRLIHGGMANGRRAREALAGR